MEGDIESASINLIGKTSHNAESLSTIRYLQVMRDLTQENLHFQQ